MGIGAALAEDDSFSARGYENKGKTAVLPLDKLQAGQADPSAFEIAPDVLPGRIVAQSRNTNGAETKISQIDRGISRSAAISVVELVYTYLRPLLKSQEFLAQNVMTVIQNYPGIGKEGDILGGAANGNEIVFIVFSHTLDMLLNNITIRPAYPRKTA